MNEVYCSRCKEKMRLDKKMSTNKLEWFWCKPCSNNKSLLYSIRLKKQDA